MSDVLKQLSDDCSWMRMNDLKTLAGLESNKDCQILLALWAERGQTCIVDCLDVQVSLATQSVMMRS